MAITPIAWLSTVTPPATAVDLVVDDDLKVRHPRLEKDLWDGTNSYATQMQACFTHVINDLKTRGFEQARIPNSDSNRAWLKEAVIRRSLAMIFLDFVTETNDRWDTLRKEYLKEYEAWLTNLNIEYDNNDDGTISDSDEETVFQVRLVR